MSLRRSIYATDTARRGKECMGVWDFDAFASDDALDVLGELDDLLAATPQGRVSGLRRSIGERSRTPCVGAKWAETRRSWSGRKPFGPVPRNPSLITAATARHHCRAVEALRAGLHAPAIDFQIKNLGGRASRPSPRVRGRDALAPLARTHRLPLHGSMTFRPKLPESLSEDL